jgi:hypothetical protein
MNNALGLLAAQFAVLILTGCGGGYGAILSIPPSYTLGGTVSGLAGSGLVLQDNGLPDLCRDERNGDDWRRKYHEYRGDVHD